MSLGVHQTDGGELTLLPYGDQLVVACTGGHGWVLPAHELQVGGEAQPQDTAGAATGLLLSLPGGGPSTVLGVADVAHDLGPQGAAAFGIHG